MVKLTLEYDGAPFFGWQAQLEGPSVQEAVERAIARLCAVPREEVRVVAAGRTDSGVHARAQVISLDPPGLGPRLPLQAWTVGLNGILPEGVAVAHAEVAPEGFDARRWAIGKRYLYTLRNAPLRSPLWRTRAWEIRRPLDVDAMQIALPDLLGKHDFSALRAGDCAASDPRRELKQLSLDRDADDGAILRLSISGTAFLKHMVRNIVGTLVDIGHHKRDPGSLPSLLASRDRSQAGMTAPSHGLMLDQVYYPDPLADPRPARLAERLRSAGAASGGDDLHGNDVNGDDAEDDSE